MYKKRLWKSIMAGTLVLTMLVTPIVTGNTASAAEPEIAEAPEANAATGDIPLDAEHFPDANFRSWIAANVDDGDNVLSQAERDACTSMSISSKQLADMTGIEYFTELTKLDCEWNELTALDVSANTKLTELNCRWNDLTVLDVSANTKLTKLNCAYNDVLTLNLSMNADLKELDCSGNELTALNLSANTKLESLVCKTNHLTALNLSANTKLKQLTCYNNGLTTLDLSSNHELTKLDCTNNKLTNLNLNGATELEEVDCKNNWLPYLDLSTNTNLNTDTVAATQNYYYGLLDESRRYDVSSISGFDTSKVSNMQGGTLSGTTLTFDEDSDTVSYLYECSSRVKATFRIKEKKMVTQVTLNQTEATVPKGNTLQLTKTVTPEDATDIDVAWTSSNDTIATVNTNGFVTAKANGTATITCAALDGSGKSATCVITVKTLATEVTLNQTAATVFKGNTLQLTATVAPSDATDNTVAWTSSNDAIATVNTNGLVTAKANGTATITCTTTDGSDKSATCVVTVKALVKQITLNKTAASITKGKSLQLSATVTPSDALDKSLTWTSSNSKVATVNSSGKVTAKAVGTATITCAANDGSGVTTTCEIMVCTNTEAFVTHLYAKALNRTPDAEGLNYWMKEINSGRKTLLQVAEGFFYAPEFTNKNLSDIEYVKILYRTFAGREYDQRGLDYWVARLSKGEGRGSVLESFTDCQECKNTVKNFELK